MQLFERSAETNTDHERDERLPYDATRPERAVTAASEPDELGSAEPSEAMRPRS